MFGTLKPPRRGSLAVVQTHRRFYCGTCQGLGTHFGLARRALLSHDAVFMAILADAVQAEAAPASRCRCPMMPTVFRDTLDPDSVPMRYAAAMQILLADQWLADRGADGQWTAGLLRAWFSARPSRRATAHLGALGVSVPALRGFEGRQLAVERGAAGPEVAAAPTAAVLAMAFETTAQLPGAAEAFGPAEVREQLASFGAAIGSAIYLLDALEDLEDDRRTGAFNACLTRDGRSSPPRLLEAITLLDAAVQEATRLVGTLPWVRHRGLLAAIVRRFAIRSNAARDAVGRRPTRQRGWSKLSAAAGAAWAWGISWTAHAAPSEVTPDLPPDVGADRLDVGGLDVGGPEPTEDLSDGPARCIGCDDCSNQCSRSCDGCFGGCAQWLGDCGSVCGACARCPDACGDASNDCCSSCGDGCNDCGQCCRGCEGCGQGCGDCGQCCQGCNDCGQGCQGTPPV